LSSDNSGLWHDGVSPQNWGQILEHRKAQGYPLCSHLTDFTLKCLRSLALLHLLMEKADWDILKEDVKSQNSALSSSPITPTLQLCPDSRCGGTAQTG
jgi:hypothetical protein